MSKFVKDLVTKDIAKRLDGVQDAVLVNVVGMDANATVELRKELRQKDISLMVVKTSLARRAAEGTSLAPAFDDMEGSLALCWGGEDYIALVKEVTRLDKDKAKYAKFEARGGVMDGEHLNADRVKEISKWPSREEQRSLLLGQILSPGSSLLSQINAPGGLLVSQLDQKAEGDE